MEVFCITVRVHWAPNSAVKDISKAFNCGVTYVGMVFWSRAET